MKIVHCLGSAEDEASGPTQSVMRLAQDQAKAGAFASVYSQGGQEVAEQGRFSHRVFPRSAYGKPILHSRAMSRAFKTLATDVVHNHGMWMMQGEYARLARKRGNSRILVTSPRGSLSSWALRHHRARKALLWPAQWRILAQSDLLHATAEHELADIRRIGLRQPVVLLPNGIDLPDRPERVLPEKRTLLFLSRIHPVKGIEMLLDAWKSLAARHPQWELAIAGPIVKSLYDLNAEIERRDLRRVRVLGGIYGDAKHDLYRSAELYVLPTHSENFGMSIAEALSHAVPVVTTRGAPWSMLETERAGWWISIGREPLEIALDEALSRDPAALAEAGTRGRDWIAAHLSWDSLAHRMIEAYQFALGERQRPEFVHVD